MRAWMIGGATVGLVGIALGCGGAWNDATKQLARDTSIELQAKVASVVDSPERLRVLAMLKDVEENSAASYGVVGIATLTTEVEGAIADGAITPDEADALEKMHQGIVSQ